MRFSVVRFDSIASRRATVLCIADTNHDGELSRAEFLKSFMELQNPKATAILPSDLIDRVLHASLYLKSSLPFEPSTEENLSQIAFQ
jgi:hypothetical protein